MPGFDQDKFKEGLTPEHLNSFAQKTDKEIKDHLTSYFYNAVHEDGATFHDIMSCRIIADSLSVPMQETSGSDLHTLVKAAFHVTLSALVFDDKKFPAPQQFFLQSGSKGNDNCFGSDHYNTFNELWFILIDGKEEAFAKAIIEKVPQEHWNAILVNLSRIQPIRNQQNPLLDKLRSLIEINMEASHPSALAASSSTNKYSLFAVEKSEKDPLLNNDSLTNDEPATDGKRNKNKQTGESGCIPCQLL